ncbi:MAG: DMT family transporter [Flavobacteriaceae bacterium]
MVRKELMLVKILHLCAVQAEWKKWVYLGVLSVIWGSSYILIKKGLVALSPLQLGSLRIIFTTIILCVVGFKHLGNVSPTQQKWLLLSGFTGTFFPSFLFSYSETVIDSSVAAVLNGMTPMFTLLVALLFYQKSLIWKQTIGIGVGFVGTLILVQDAFTFHLDHGGYALLVILASICYALNANWIKYKLEGVSPMAIALYNFLWISIPAGLILLYDPIPIASVISDTVLQKSMGYILILSLVGTAFAKVLFNQLLTFSSTVFAVSITYLLPIVAIGWGVLDGESFGWVRWVGCLIILTGVFLVTEKKKE